MYAAYALDTTSGFCDLPASTWPEGFITVRNQMRVFVIPTPSIDAPKPTHKSLPPLRIGAAARCAKDHDGNPAGTTPVTGSRFTRVHCQELVLVGISMLKHLAVQRGGFEKSKSSQTGRASNIIFYGATFSGSGLVRVALGATTASGSSLNRAGVATTGATTGIPT